MFVRGLLALEERRRVGADRVVRPYEWQRFALRDVGDAVPYEQAVVIPAAPSGFCFSSPSILPSAPFCAARKTGTPYDLTSSDEVNSSCGKVSASRNACARRPARVRLRRTVELG